MLTLRYKNKPIILLDEYDTPLHEAWLNNYLDEFVSFMQVFFISTFKTNPYLGRAIITGITRISEKLNYPDLNNIKVVSITSNHYADCFGFTENEVFTSMDEYGLKSKKEVKNWYDGYIFANLKEIYNPWSIINFLKDRKLEPYWKASSSNSLVADLITHGNATLKQDTATLLEGKSIPIKLDESIVFSKLYTKEGVIWSLLLQAGYVKPLSYNPSTQISEVALTNYESRIIFEDFITEWFDQVRQAKNEFNQAILKNNLQDMNIFMSEISEQIFSYFDTSKQGKSEPENFYHAFVLGLILDLKDKYKISSNRDSGFGRYDVMLSPRCLNDPGIVIEFKRFRKNIETSLVDTCANALKQIYEKHYTAELKKDGLTSNQIFVYGFAFKGKEVLISGGGYDTLDWPSILKK
ncbi:MAG: AAA family ATPase [Desulfovibrionaceae bacterium]|nr:AAA family ATPase [Desulfovibrionaceae bacterium]